MVPVIEILRLGIVWLASFALGVGSAAAVVHLAVRTRFFATPDREPDTWHGRPIRQGDREFEDGFNPFILGFVTFWVAFTAALILLDGPMPG